MVYESTPNKTNKNIHIITQVIGYYFCRKKRDRCSAGEWYADRWGHRGRGWSPPPALYHHCHSDSVCEMLHMLPMCQTEAHRCW